MSIVIKENENLVIEDIGATNITLQNYASVTHIFKNTDDVKKLTVDLGLGASYVAVFLQKNNDFTLTVNLNAPQAKTDIASVFLADNQQKSSVFINHKASNTYSNQLFKGIAWGKGLSDVVLKTFVDTDLKSIEAYQLLRGIVLDETAGIKSAPLLDIHSDDVICTHGSAVGMIDRAQIFYLQSRGLDIKQANKILLSAFVDEVLDKISDESIRAKFIDLGSVL